MTNEVEEETFSAPESSNHQPERRSAVTDSGNVLKKSFRLGSPSNLNKVKALSGHQAGLKGLEDGVPFASLDLHGGSVGGKEFALKAGLTIVGDFDQEITKSFV